MSVPTLPTVMAGLAGHEHKDSPRDVIVAYLLLLIGALLLVGAAYGFWLLVARII